MVQTSERLGFHALLIPTRFVNGLFDEGAPLAETWTMATALAAVTSRIHFLIAIRPGFIAAGLLAKMIATLDQISGGRVDINIVPGGIQGDFERLGVEIDHAGRYEQAEELMRLPGAVDRRGSRFPWDLYPSTRCPLLATAHGHTTLLSGGFATCRVTGSASR